MESRSRIYSGLNSSLKLRIREKYEDSSCRALQICNKGLFLLKEGDDCLQTIGTEQN